MEWMRANRDVLTLGWQAAVLAVPIVSLGVAYRRAVIAQFDNLRTRFQKGTEMFGGAKPSNRLSAWWPRNMPPTV